MSALESRLTRLEAAASPHGPLLMSWRLDPDARATTTYEGRTYTQATDEGSGQFMARVAASVPRCAVVWVNQLDEQL